MEIIQTSQDAHDSIQWKTGTSKNGAAYQYGVSKTAPASMSEAALASDAKPEDPASDDSNPMADLQFHPAGGSNAGVKDVAVTWEVTGDVWTSVDANSTAYVDKYSLHIDHYSVIYDWELEFQTNTKGYYRFWDSSNPKNYFDVEVDVVSYNHDVCFNSDYPKISEVQYRSFTCGISF